MGFIEFLGRHLVASFVGAIGLVLIALGYADEARRILSAPPWALQGTGAILFVIAVVKVLYAFDKEHRPNLATSEPASAVAQLVLPPSPAPQPIKPKASIPPKPKVFVGPDVTPRYLMDLLEGHTHAQGLKLSEAYIGKWMRFTVRIEDVYPITESVHACAKFDAAYGHLWLAFSKSNLERVETLTIGERVTLIGRIAEIGKYEVSFDRCQFAEPNG